MTGVMTEAPDHAALRASLKEAAVAPDYAALRARIEEAAAFEAAKTVIGMFVAKHLPLPNQKLKSRLLGTTFLSPQYA